MDTIHGIKFRPIFKEEHYSCSLKPFSWVFADIPASGSSFLRLVKTECSSNTLSRLVHTNFGLISKWGNRRIFFSSDKTHIYRSYKFGVYHLSLQHGHYYHRKDAPLGKQWITIKKERTIPRQHNAFLWRKLTVWQLKNWRITDVLCQWVHLTGSG